MSHTSGPRLACLLVPLLVPACFDPSEAGPDTDTDTLTDGTGAATTGPTGGASLTSPDSTASDPTMTSADATGTTNDPDTGPDPDGTTGDTNEACTASSECGAGELCIDEACQSCDAARDPDALCAAETPDTPVCDLDTMLCAACSPAQCSGATPVCDPDAGCAACTEHEQCPDSACHLLGPDQGTCFDVADVVEVSDISELEAELAAAGAGNQRVLRLSAETFEVSGSLGVAGEVALLGQPGTVITGGATNLFSVSGTAYVDDLVIADGPFRALSCLADAGGLWVDDTAISGYSVAIQGNCETHVRRSSIRTTSGVGTVAVIGNAPLFAENSAFGPGSEIALQLGDIDIDMRYVTIAGNGTSLECTSSTGGIVRNSIVVGTAAGSISGCFNMWVDNAVDSPSRGMDVGPYDEAWFVDPAAGDFHLTPAGEAAIGALADWDRGDPALDIDGDTRPMDAASFPGLDEP